MTESSVKIMDLNARKRDLLVSISEQEESRKNKDFVQFKRNGIKFIRKIVKENALAAEIFMLLTEFMDHKNVVICSSKVMQEYFSVSRSTVYRATKYLEEKHYVITLNSGSMKIFTVNPEIAWTTYANKKSFCTFDGKIILSESENKDFLIKSDKFKSLMFNHHK